MADEEFNERALDQSIKDGDFAFAVKELQHNVPKASNERALELVKGVHYYPKAIALILVHFACVKVGEKNRPGFPLPQEDAALLQKATKQSKDDIIMPEYLDRVIEIVKPYF